MHEFGVTRSIVGGLLAELERQHVEHVQTVRFRRSSAFSEDVLRQAFEALGAGTPLEGARLIVDIATIQVTCARCGNTAVADADTLVGHIYVCPVCATTREVKEARDLELMEVRAER